MTTWRRSSGGLRKARRGGIFFSLLVLLFWIALVVVVYLLRHPLMRLAGNFWVVDESPDASDVIVVLGDDNYAGDRATRAAELFKAGRAARVVASGRYLRPYASIAQLEEHDLADRGVPASAILRLAHRAQNTREESIAIGQLLASRGWRRVLLVTSNYHTRRSRYICAREFPAGTVVRVVAARDVEYDPDRWWETRAGIKIFFGESVAMLVAIWELRHNGVQTEGSDLFARPPSLSRPPVYSWSLENTSRFTRQLWLYYSSFTWHLRPGVFGKEVSVWRKATEAKPSSRPSGAPVPAQVPVRTGPVAAPSAAPGQAVPQPSASPGPAVPRILTARDNSGVSRLGSGLKVRGEISGNEDLYVDGETQGRITLADGRLTIGPKGHVQADIEARDIVIEGAVQGNVKARESVYLGPSSRVQGSVLTKRIGIDDGALLRGKVETNHAVAGRGPVAAAQAADGAALRPVFARGEDE